MSAAISQKTNYGRYRFNTNVPSIKTESFTGIKFALLYMLTSVIPFV